MADGVYRNKGGFTIVQKGIVRDRIISLKAKGLYLVIQSYITMPEKVWRKSDFLKLVKERRRFHVFVLTYRVSVEACAVKAMGDIARAMAIIDKNRDVFHVDPAKYLICGFSAGGYVVCLWNTEKSYEAFNLPKPQAAILIYPVTSYCLMEGREFGVWANRDVHGGLA